MQIHNVRLGLATNSSSTHSIIFMNPGVDLPTDEYTNFDWQYFTASDERSKTNYLSRILYHNLRDKIGYHGAEQVIKSLLSTDPDVQVDHQSVHSLPSTWDGKSVDLEFFEDLRKYVVGNRIAILGGNDNGENDHPYKSEGKVLSLGLRGRNIVARNDSTHWVIFNRDNGTKIRLTFGSDDVEATDFKPTTPELIDLKITDYCPFGCKFCYQSSTTSGKHGNSSWISSLVYKLAEMKVFEVAIGGGEPTLHPEFTYILDSLKSNDIVANFTTKNLAWLRDSKTRLRVLNSCGAFAYSVGQAKDVDDLAECRFSYNINNEKIAVQYVLESGGDLRGVLEKAKKWNIQVTLLGFKKVGFGQDFPTVKENWISVVKQVKGDKSIPGWLKLGVDTAIMQEYRNQIKDNLNVHPILFTTEEGRYSMYIDAVEQKMGPSSYCKDSEYVEITDNEQIQEAFSKW